MTGVLYAGSFDPIHLGHLSVIERAASMFDSVVVAVLANPNKRSGLFDVDARVDLVAASVARLPNVSCTRHQGLTVDAARQARVDGIIRTGHKDRADEWSMLAVNGFVSGFKTFFIPPDPSVAHLSSSLVRSLLAAGQRDEAAALVPGPVTAAFA